MKPIKIKDYNFPSVNVAKYDKDLNIVLYYKDSFLLMDELIERFPDGVFDMIFAGPPYFLSNGGITCYSGKMKKVDKGEWDKSKGVNENHKFNLNWLSKCKKLLKKDGTLWVTGTNHIIYSVGFAIQQLEMKILNDISWENQIHHLIYPVDILLTQQKPLFGQLKIKIQNISLIMI